MIAAASSCGYYVTTNTRDAWEMLCCLPTALAGVWNPERSSGTVTFATMKAAQIARRKV